MAHSNSRQIIIAVKTIDALSIDADVLALKYAQSLYGLDRSAVNKLSESGLDITALLPKIDGFRLVDSGGSIGAESVLFVGVKPLSQFGYKEIREFARKVLVSLAGARPDSKHVCLTIHGPGYGLDERESFEAEIAGLLDAIAAGDFPEKLGKITIIERSRARAQRLRDFLSRLVPHGKLDVDGRGHLESLGEKPAALLRAVGYESGSKPNVFVAMPFSDDMEDTFHFGIQGAVNAAGYLCERGDQSVFTGDVMQSVKKRIATASLIIADLSTANPNVYLEVGYAWGCGKPTVLLVRDVADLKFDVKNQRCLVYKSIKHLENILREALEALRESPNEQV
jgi:hypothetical protein